MSEPPHEEVAARLERFIREQFSVAEDDDAFGRRVNLAEEGYVDSVGLVEVVAFLEDGFGVTIPEDALFELASFDIDSLAGLVGSLRAGAGEEVAHFERDPDLSPVCELIRATWERPCWDYTPALLDAYLRRPTGDPSLSVAMVDGGRIAAYQAVVPYPVVHRGTAAEIVQGGFWTGNPAFAGKAAGLAILREVLRLSRERGCAGFCAVMERDGQAARVLEASEGERGLTLVKTFQQQVTTPARLRRRAEGEAPPRYAPEDREVCLALLAGIAEVAELAKQVPAEDVEFVLRERPGTATWVYRVGGEARALLNVMRADMLVPGGRRAAGFLENLALGSLEPDERDAFLRSVFLDPFWSEVQVVSAPTMGYADAVLAELGFLPAQQQFNLYWLPFDDTLRIDSLASCHLDLL